MVEVTNMFDLNKLHLEDELNEDVSFEVCDTWTNREMKGKKHFLTEMLAKIGNQEL